MDQWGVKEGCYLVLPVLGPTTARDTLGSLANFFGGDAWYNVTVRNDTKYFRDLIIIHPRLQVGVDFRAKNFGSLFDNLRKKLS